MTPPAKYEGTASGTALECRWVRGSNGNGAAPRGRGKAVDEERIERRLDRLIEQGEQLERGLPKLLLAALAIESVMLALILWRVW